MAKNIFDKFQGFFLDGDGVLYKEEHSLPGAEKFLKFLQEKKRKIFILTNNSTKQRLEYKNKLEKMGLDIPINNILTSSYLTAKSVAEEKSDAIVYVIGEQGLKEELKNFELTVVNDWEETNEEDPFDFNFKNIDYVITGMDRRLNYTKLTRAMNILQNKKISFIGTNADITFPTPRGYTPGGGAMIHILEKLSGRQIQDIIGKPKPLMYEQAFKMANLPKSQILMIGDRIETDILGAKKFGLSACLLLTGTSKVTDLQTIEKKYQPDILANNLLDIYEELSEN